MSTILRINVSKKWDVHLKFAQCYMSNLSNKNKIKLREYYVKSSSKKGGQHA